MRKIRDLLDDAAVEAGRDPGSVQLLAVSKKQPVTSIREAADAGQRAFGENFVQEGVEKIRAVGRSDLTWHFIGHLQSNKTRAVAEYFDWVHTIETLRVARRLSEQRPPALGPLQVCLQVNVDAEDSKSGMSPGEVPALARAVGALPNLRLRGLMCLPAVREDFRAQRKPFATLRKLADTLRREGIDLDTLSMGMTGDFRAAIFEGATIVRIGTAVFGERR